MKPYLQRCWYRNNSDIALQVADIAQEVADIAQEMVNSYSS